MQSKKSCSYEWNDENDTKTGKDIKAPLRIEFSRR